MQAMGLATLAVSALAAPPTAHAAGIVGNGTAASCTDAALDAALAGGGLVTFDCGPDGATIDVSPDSGGTGTKAISRDTTIDGAGRITISGGHRVLVFSVMRGVMLAVQNLTIADGNGQGGHGGGIATSGGTLIVSHTTFAGNSTGRGGFGGAIAVETDIPLHGAVSHAALTVTDSTFAGNSAPEGLGGGISSRSSASLVVSGSTFAGNSAYRGGGIFFDDNSVGGGASLTVSNSTFADNRADGDRGGGLLIYPRARGSLTVSNCTFAGNRAALSGGGIQKGCDAQGCPSDAGDAALTIANTILASNAGGNCAADSAAAIADGGHNVDDGTTCGFSTATGSLINTDPALDPAGLQDNGGPTYTIALQPDSLAIGAGSDAACAAPPVNNLDQRGFVRPGSTAAHCSIGAYEYTLPGSSDCCQCPNSCVAPADGACGDCLVVFDATCEGDALCVLHTPTPTSIPTASAPPTLTPSRPPSPTHTPLTPSPTPTLGASACCQCADFCAAPIHGTCGGCAVVLDASCTSESLCVARTPAPASPPCMGDCSGDGRVTVGELVTLVRMALGDARGATCPSGLPPDDAVSGASTPAARVHITELLTAVDNGLRGCPSP